MSRPARTWEFLDAVGQRASILGKEDGSLEAYVYPLKLFSDLQFSFHIGERVIPAAAISRRVISDVASVSIVYTGDEFRVVETLTVPVHDAGGIVELEVEAHAPLTILFSLHPDFQFMWPASFGSAFGQWNADKHLFVFGADGKPYAAVLGGNNLTLESGDYATNYSSQKAVHFSLGTVNGSATRTIAFGGSMTSRNEAENVEAHLAQNAAAVKTEADAYYAHYLDETTSVELPDKDLQTAYDWSRLSLVKGMVANPFLGTGLVAGYGPSKGSYRPGFAWFFGRDSFWSSFAFDSEGDWQNSRDAIEFISRFQRADGKIPHEISQSAAQVAWSKDYPYEYASADATPLFIIAVRDYVRQSGDREFGNKMWPLVQKAMAFSKSTFDSDGFPKNFGVGHGWVEGGPLLPVQVELYMAGCYVEAVQALSELARWTGHTTDGAALEQEAVSKQKKLDDLFWLSTTQNYAFAIGNDGKPVDEPSVLALVPEWWKLLDLGHAQTMTQHLAEESHQSDWGMRIISSHAKLYNPAGYHFGSVWPLFTGWASVGEYNAHMASTAFANLKANSWLTLDGAGGNTTEVLSGESYSPLSTATPHQIWSAAMVISPVLRGLFGLSVDSIDRKVTLAPHFPPEWTDVALKHIRIGDGYADFKFHRTEESLSLRIDNHVTTPWTLAFAPAYSPYTTVTAATLEGRAASYKRQDNTTDWHPVIESRITQTAETIELSQKQLFGISIPVPAPKLAETSSNLKMISEEWTPDHKSLTLTVSGLAGANYELRVAGPANVVSVNGAQQVSDSLRLKMPPGESYVQTKVRILLK